MLQVGEQAYDGDSELRKEVQALQERRLLRTLAVIQDVSDSMLALNDIRGEPSRSHSPDLNCRHCDGQQWLAALQVPCVAHLLLQSCCDPEVQLRLEHII